MLTFIPVEIGRPDFPAYHSQDAPYPSESERNSQFFTYSEPPDLIEESQNAPLLTPPIPAGKRPSASSPTSGAPTRFRPTDSIFWKDPFLCPCYKPTHAPAVR